MLNIDLPWEECLALGLDLGVFLLFRAILRQHVKILKDIQNAPRFESYAELRANLSIDAENMEASGAEIPESSSVGSPEMSPSSYSSSSTSSSDCSSIPYAIIEGRVEAVDSPIASQFRSSESGVLKTFTIRNHKLERRHGLWHEKMDDIHKSVRDVPFKIVLSKDAAATPQSSFAGLVRWAAVEGVEFRDVDKVDNPLHGELDVVYDKFEHSSAGFGKSLMDNVRGDVDKGIQETEKMLLVGTKVTAIGRVILKGGENGIKMVFPSKDHEFILTKKTYEEIVRGYQDATGLIRVVTYILGATGFILSCLIARRVFKEIQERRQYSALLRQLSDHRRAEAQNTEQANGTTTTNDDDDDDATSPIADCIVCMSNPRDVILLTCGHVCVCSNCATMLPSNRCPVCRSQIDRVQSFFIA